MILNDVHVGIHPRKPRKRIGRGIGSGHGKTAGRGHKGFYSRSGSKRRAGFEGGQMPLQRRLPKFGFTSRSGRYVTEVRLHELAKVEADVIDVAALKAADLIGNHIQVVKIMLSGELNKAVKIRGIKASQGARAAIEAAGGSIED